MTPSTAADQPVLLSWVRGKAGPGAHVNLGDALSPFMVTMVSGRPVRHAAFVDGRPRMAAVGTIGQNLRGGRVAVWGAGCSPWLEPTTARRAPYRPPADTILELHATRGPMSARLLGGGAAPDVPFGDPAMLLPRFYPRGRKRRYELGVVLHLAELADRGLEANPRPGVGRYGAPPDWARLITMVARPSVDGVRRKLDELLSCRRIVSTSLHGFALALAYGIPCLYVGSDRGPDGLARAALDGADAERVNARFVDLLLGLGAREIVYWRQRRRTPTNWDALARAVDEAARPYAVDADALMACCPAGLAPLRPPSAGATIWDHPAVRATPLLDAPPGRFAGLLDRFGQLGRLGGGFR